MGALQTKKVKHYLFADIVTRDYLAEQLIKACLEVDTKKAYQALELGVPVNSAILHRRSYLYPLQALFLGSEKTVGLKARVELLQMLVDFGANVNVVDDRGKTAIHHLCSWGSLATREGPQLLGMLIRLGAHPHLEDADGNTPIHYCCRSDDRVLLNCLMADERVDVTTANNDGKTCLHFAAHVGNSLLAKKLIERGCEVNKQSRNGNTPLHEVFHQNNWSATSVPYLPGGNESTLNLLFSYGAKADIQNNKFQTPCILALEAGLHRLNNCLFVMFMNRCENLNFADSKGNTLLHLCYTSESDIYFSLMFSAYLTFISHGVNGNIRNHNGSRALELCINLLYKKDFSWIPERFPEMFVNHISAGVDIQTMPMREKAKFLYLCRHLQHSDMVTTLKIASRCGFSFLLSAEEESYLLQREFMANDGVLHFLQTDGGILPLKQMCGNLIRTSLWPNAMVSIDKLDLPQSLVNFIMCRL